MHYRTLGRTGLRVSEIGMGGISAAGKYGPIVPEGAGQEMLRPHAFKNVELFSVVPEVFAVTMSQASAAGINFIDTAPSYGDSEAVFGHYLKEHREKWLLCTKIGTCGNWGDGRLPNREEIVTQVHDSLARLQVEQLDVLLIHSLEQYGKGEEATARVLTGGMVEVMRELQQNGTVRFIGVSGQLPELVPAVKSGAFDVVLTYNSFNLLIQDAQRELFPLAREMNVGVILGGAFYQGLLTGNPEFVLKKKEQFFETTDPAYYETQELVARVERLTDFVGGDAGALRRLALRFALTDPAVSVVVSGMGDTEEVKENEAAAEPGPLTDAEIEEVMNVVKGK